MSPAYSSGIFYSDLIVGEKEDVTDDVLAVAPTATPFLNSIGWPGKNRAEALTHQYLDDAFVPQRTTLNGAILVGALSLTLTDPICEPGSRIVIEGELILLGASADRLTFAITRSLGTIAAAGHANGVNVLHIEKPQVQGAAAGDAASVTEPRLVTNYVQEFERIIEVPDTANVARRYGRPGLVYDEKVEQNMLNMILGVEYTNVFGKSVAPNPSGGVAGAMDGLVERVIGTNTAALGGANFTLTDLQDGVDVIADYYDADEDLNATLLVPLYQMRIFAGWQQAHVEMAPGDPAIETYGVTVRRLRVNSMLIDVVPNQRTGNVSPLYQPKYIKPLGHIAFTHEKLARDGRRMRGMISGACTNEVYNPEAHYIFTGVKVA